MVFLQDLQVSILVMMDLSFLRLGIVKSADKVDGFNPCYDGFVILTTIHSVVAIVASSFNPCYDGFVILTSPKTQTYTEDIGFNPCYDGFVILTLQPKLIQQELDAFQSLL